MGYCRAVERGFGAVGNGRLGREVGWRSSVVAEGGIAAEEGIGVAVNYIVVEEDIAEGTAAAAEGDIAAAEEGIVAAGEDNAVAGGFVGRRSRNSRCST